MRVRAFNAEGLQRMSRWHTDVKAGTAALDDVADLLSDDELTRVLGEVDDGLMPSVAPSSRFAAAAHLHTSLAPLIDRRAVDVGSDDGFWTWLAGMWRHHLVKPVAGTAESPRLGESARWISVLSSSRRRYRHLLAGPYLLYAKHADGPERVRFLLENPLHTPGELAGQVGASESLISSTTAMELATMLYWDAENGRVRARVRGKDRAGTVRRLALVLNQFARTYSFESIEVERLRELLPREFADSVD